METNLWILFFGVFFAETIKNVAKGSASVLQEGLSNYLKPEIIALGLDAEDSVEDFQKKLEAKPEIKEEIKYKLEANPDLFNELITVLRKQESRNINTKTYIENASNFTINQ